LRNYDPEETRRVMGFFFVVTIVYLLIFNSLLSPGETVYVKEGNIYKGFFTEPFETIVFIFKNGDCLAFTNRYESRVYLPIGYLENFLKKRNKKIEDIEIAIHNHGTPSNFSPKNYRYYRGLKARGFKGIFKIYYPFDGRARNIED